MDENRSVTKMFLGAGLVVAFVLMLISFKVYAFEGFEVVGYPFTVINGTNSIQQFTDRDLPDSAFYSISYESWDIGIASSFPVPYYSDGDHYSVFMNFTFSVPYQAIVNNQWIGIYVRPMLSNTQMSTVSSGQWLTVNVLDVAPGTGYTGGYTDLRYGSFMWQGDTQCSYKMLITCMNDANITANQPRIYNIAVVFDLNLTAGSTLASDELRPFSVSARYYTGYPTISSGYGLALHKDFIIRCTDTSMYGAIENLANVVADLDFSGLAGLADLSTTIENWYSSYTSVSSTIVDRLEDIIDDGETDPDITEWAEQASEFESKNDLLHDLEESLEGTIEDFTFPQVANQTAVGNVVGTFFNNEFIIALTLAMMTLMIVFLIL